jgi:acetoacetate decarboxylase
MSTMEGFFAPRTPTGKSAVAPEMPWFYSGNLLTVEYRTDPKNIKALLPNGIELADEDPGAVAIIWADWQSCSQSKSELLDPLRSQYLEAFAVIRCKYEGEGYPKKFGSIGVTRIFNHGKATPKLEKGAQLGASLAATDYRLATARVTLNQPSATNGFVNGHPMLHNRWVPSITPGLGNSLDQLITMSGVDADLGQPWAGEAELELFDSPWDELASILPIKEIIGGFYREVGVTFNGGKLLLDTSNPSI